MKHSKQLIGLPIISVNNGTQVGNVKSLVINPDTGSIDFLTVEHEDWQVSVKATPYKKIIGIGDYAVTIESEVNIIDLTEIPIANALVSKNIKVAGTKVMTRMGHLIGNVKEYYIDDKSGQLIGIEVENESEVVYLSTDYVVTFGKDILIVNEIAEESYVNSPEQFQQSKEEESMNLVKEKQASILEGKTVTKDILTKDGSVLIESGTVLTQELIKTAQEAGPLVMAEVTMNVE